jgi:ACS family tartrate transporter-like MFS transporter
MHGTRTVDASTYRIIVTRFVPLLFIGQLLQQIDRTNISFAALQMNADLAISAELYGLAAGIFFLGYAVIEVPSNLVLQRIGPRRLLGSIIIVWGLITVLQAFVPNAETFVVLRFLLGVAEGGFLPGIFFALTIWLPAGQRGRSVAIITAATPISAVIGGPVAGLLMQITLFDLAGWQWLFIIEGVGPVLFGLLWFRLVPNRPADARWLSESARTELTRIIDAEHAEAAARPHGARSFLAALRSRSVWIYCAAYFVLAVGYWGVFFWLPQTLKAMFTSIDATQTGFLSAVPYVLALAALLVFGRTSDATGDRRWHLVAFGGLAGAGLLVAITVTDPVVAFAAICVAVACGTAYIGVFWASPMYVLAGAAAAGSIALINTLGAPGAFLGPYLVGLLGGVAGGADTATATLSIFLFVAGAIPLVFRSRFPNTRTASPAPVEAADPTGRT